MPLPGCFSRRDFIQSICRTGCKSIALFRPSLIFFLNFLWLADRSLFWQVSLDVFGSDNLPERMRVIVATAIYESASTISDLQPLLNAAEDVSDVGTTALLKAIHAFDKSIIEAAAVACSYRGARRRAAHGVHQ